jgi:hypothetical protein
MRQPPRRSCFTKPRANEANEWAKDWKWINDVLGSEKPFADL